MSDLLQTGITWHAAKLAAKVGQSVTYRRGAHSVAVTATFGQSDHEGEMGGMPVEIHSRDFLIDVADLVLNSVAVTPARGDVIEYVDPDGLTVTHELMSMSNHPSWRYTDPYRTKYRIHTERIYLPS